MFVVSVSGGEISFCMCVCVFVWVPWLLRTGIFDLGPDHTPGAARDG